MPKVPAELELAKVLRQMAVRDLNVRALDRPFKQAEEAFRVVHVAAFDRILLVLVIAGLVLIAFGV